MTLIAGYSRSQGTWGVFTVIDESQSQFLWSCRSEQDAIELADKINSGATICKGAPILRNNCGTCVKCKLVNQ